MTVDITVEFDGLRELQDRLNRLDNIGAAIGPALVLGGADVLTAVRQYPPAGPGNLPGPAPSQWYVRGTGMYYARVRGGVRIVKSSEQLNRRWSTKYTMTPQEATVRIGNSASYARYVHDREKQASFHAARGWQTVQATLDKLRGSIVRRVEAAIAAHLR